MREASRLRGPGQYWLTQGHLAALGTTTLFLAALAFFVGLTVGKRQGAIEVPVAPVATLVGGAEQADSLADLLARVEEAAAAELPTAQAGTLSFPDQLKAAELEVVVPDVVEPVDEVPVVALVEAPVETAPVPPVPGDGVPTDGWAVQVAAFPTLDEAEARVVALREQDHSAYRIEAFVKGQTWYRVRIGPYGTKGAAEKAALELGESLGQSDLMVTEVQ